MHTNKNNYKKGSTVFWKWGKGKIKGAIEAVYFNPIEKEIKAKKSNYKVKSTPSYERKRIGGEKKVNAFRDGFKILISMISLFLF